MVLKLDFAAKKVSCLLPACLIIIFVIPTTSKSTLEYKTKFALAQAHYERVRGNTECALPQPRVFRVGTPDQKLVPPATILHRCGDHAGCCDFPTESCVAKSKEKLKLFFFVKSASGQPWRKNKRLKVKKLFMTNHTSCHCVDKRNIPR